MNDEAKKDTRPWYKKKTNWGLVLLGIGGTLAAIPAAPVIATIGSVSITTTVVSTGLTYIGTIMGGYGIADRVSKNK